jgi:hypothetical protein
MALCLPHSGLVDSTTHPVQKGCCAAAEFRGTASMPKTSGKTLNIGRPAEEFLNIVARANSTL